MFEHHVEDNIWRYQQGSKRVGDELEQESAKRQKLEKEDDFAELKRCLELVPEDDDDVTIKATLLSSKSPTIVDYKIYKEGKKSYFKIIRADGNSQSYLTFRKMFKNFNRKDLEVLWSIVKERFKFNHEQNNHENDIVDPKFKAKPFVRYPSFDPSTPWDQYRPVLGMMMAKLPLKGCIFDLKELSKGWKQSDVPNCMAVGLLEAVAGILPDSEHRQCARHIYANFKRKWNGLQYKRLFWGAASCTVDQQFLLKMEQIKVLDPAAHKCKKSETIKIGSPIKRGEKNQVTEGGSMDDGNLTAEAKDFMDEELLGPEDSLDNAYSFNIILDFQDNRLNVQQVSVDLLINEAPENYTTKESQAKDPDPKPIVPTQESQTQTRSKIRKQVAATSMMIFVKNNGRSKRIAMMKAKKFKFDANDTRSTADKAFDVYEDEE
nr:hypothetical protein [Tanacetum cinerariifolium]